MQFMKYFLTTVAAFTLTTSIVGCNTVEGAAEGGEEDIEAVGDTIDDAAD